MEPRLPDFHLLWRDHPLPKRLATDVVSEETAKARIRIDTGIEQGVCHHEQSTTAQIISSQSKLVKKNLLEEKKGHCVRRRNESHTCVTSQFWDRWQKRGDWEKSGRGSPVITKSRGCTRSSMVIRKHLVHVNVKQTGDDYETRSMGNTREYRHHYHV